MLERIYESDSRTSKVASLRLLLMMFRLEFKDDGPGMRVFGFNDKSVVGLIGWFR